MKQNKSIIAFDIGASKIAYGVTGLPLSAPACIVYGSPEDAASLRAGKAIAGRSSFQHFDKIKTPKSKKEVIERIIGIVKKIKKDKKIAAVGIGMAGQIDFEKGKVLSSLVADGWKNVSLKNILEKKLKIPVTLDNDAHCFVLGEAKFGAAKKYQHIIGLTLGTKIGSGIIIGGKLYRGANNTAGEFGYTIKANKSLNISIKELKKELKKSCSKTDYHYLGEWTAGRGMERLYKKLTGEKLNCLEIKKRAIKKEKAALKIINLSAESLGCEIANIINFLNPEIIVIGGGLSKMDILWNPMIQEAKKRVFFPPLKKTKIVRSRLLEKANLLGAASLVLES
jgi:glucokinase